MLRSIVRMAEIPLDSTVQTARLGILRRIYDWCIDAADKPYALWILAAVSFAESSFFPVPPDVMLLPMSLARPRQAWLFATLCTSVAGGCSATQSAPCCMTRSGSG